MHKGSKWGLLLSVILIVLVVAMGVFLIKVSIHEGTKSGASRPVVASPDHTQSQGGAATAKGVTHPHSGRTGHGKSAGSHTGTAGSSTQAAVSASSIATTVSSMLGDLGSPPATAAASPHATVASTSSGAATPGAAKTLPGVSVLQKAAHSPSMKPSQQAIVAPFVAQLEVLQSQYVGSLNALYLQAKTTYHAGKASKLAIEAKYLPQFGALENRAQDQVNSILFTMRAALSSHGYPSTEMAVLRDDFYSAVQQEMARLRG